MRKRNVVIRPVTRGPSALMLGFFLAGCATSMSKPLDDTAPPAPSEGIVIGSVIVQTTQQEPSSTFRLFLVSASKVKYALHIEELKGLGYLVEEPNVLAKQLSLRLAVGQEKTFVTKLSAGPYQVRTLEPLGYKEATVLLGIRFDVAPGRTTYIGRLVFEVPEKLPLAKGIPEGLASLPHTMRIEDTQEATIESIRDAHPDVVADVVKDLMRPSAATRM